MGEVCYLWFNFLNAFEIENTMRFWWNFIKTLYGQYGSNRIVRIVSWLEFARNVAKFNIDRIICDFDKDWSNFTKLTIWINPYCPWLNFLKIFQVEKKELSMETYVQLWKGQYGSKFDQHGSNILLIWICYKHWKVQHRSNYMLLW